MGIVGGGKEKEGDEHGDEGALSRYVHFGGETPSRRTGEDSELLKRLNEVIKRKTYPGYRDETPFFGSKLRLLGVFPVVSRTSTCHGHMSHTGTHQFRDFQTAFSFRAIDQPPLDTHTYRRRWSKLKTPFIEVDLIPD